MTARGAARRSGQALAVSLCLLAFEAAAQDCTIDNADLSGALRSMPDVLAVQVSNRRDPDSDEPVLRQLVDYADGSTLVLEQQNCLMHNLRVTLLSRESMPDETGLRRLGTVLGMTPVWSRYFARYDPVAVAIAEPKSPEFTSMKATADQFSYPLGDRLSAEGENSEAITSFMSTDSAAAQFASELSLYIGVGGQ